MPNAVRTNPGATLGMAHLATETHVIAIMVSTFMIFIQGRPFPEFCRTALGPMACCAVTRDNDTHMNVSTQFVSLIGSF